MLKLRNAKNFTPHDVVVFTTSKDFITFPSLGNCRAPSTQGLAYEWWPATSERPEEALTEAPGWGHRTDGRVLIMKRPVFTGVEFVPHEPAESETVIVSIVAAPALVGARPDLRILIPDTGPESAVRDGDGKIAGVKRLILWHDPDEAERPVKLVECFTPNPADGWRVLKRFPLNVEGVVGALGWTAEEPGFMAVYGDHPPACVDKEFRHADDRGREAIAAKLLAEWQANGPAPGFPVGTDPAAGHDGRCEGRPGGKASGGGP